MSEVALALLRRDGRCFLQRRALDNPVLPGLWEFPGGKLEPGETPGEALHRELREEVAVTPSMVRSLPVFEGPARLHPFLVEASETPRTPLAWGWFLPEEMLRLPVPPPNRDLIRRLLIA